MKFKNKILYTLTCLLSLTILTGCGKGESVFTDNNEHIYINDENVATTGYEDVHVDPSKTYYQGTHDFTMKSTGKALLKNGKTSYKIVIPELFTSVISTAKDELIHFFKIATGVTLDFVFDTNLEFDQNNKFISIGQTTLLQQANLDIDYLKLGDDGLRIITKGNTIFLVGGTDAGSLFAVYDFLHIYFRYEQYSPDVYEIDRNVKNLVLYDFDVTDIPDSRHRAQNWGFQVNGNGDYDQSKYGYRSRMYKSRGYYMMPVYREFDYGSPNKKSTNTDYYVPYDIYAAEHPKWFSNNCKSGSYQLCYTARGDAEELEGLIDIVTRKIQFSMSYFTPDKYPDMNVMTFTMEDNFDICECEECKKYEAKYETITSTLVLFVNEVGRRIAKWQALPENAYLYRENFQIMYFAYNGYTDAPVTYNAKTKTYAPSYPEVELEPNTGVYLAIIDRGDFQYDFFNNPINAGGKNQNMGVKETIDSWGAVTDSIYLWLYNNNFGFYPYFFDSFSHFTQPMYNYISSKGLKMFFNQGQDTNASGESGTNFTNLKAYLNAKLSWDSTLDQTTLMQRYFKAMYGAGHKEMWNYYGALRAHNKYLLDTYPQLTNARSIYNSLAKRDYYPLETLQSLISLVDAAKEKITLEQYTKEQYDLYRNNMDAEALHPMYAQLTLYGDIDLNDYDRYALAKRCSDNLVFMRNTGMSTKEHGGTAVYDVVSEYLN